MEVQVCCSRIRQLERCRTMTEAVHFSGMNESNAALHNSRVRPAASFGMLGNVTNDEYSSVVSVNQGTFQSY